MALNKKTFFYASVLPFAVASAANAQATNAEVLNEIRALKDRITQLETQLATERSAPKTATVNDDIKVSLNPGLSVETADGGTSFSVDGRVAVDAGSVIDDGNADLANATDLRYLWAGFKGTIDHDWQYRLLVGLENDATSVKDAYVAYNGFNNLTLRAGHFKEYNGIENMSSNLYTTFLERSSSITTYRDLRNIGFGIEPYGDNWGVQLGYFGEGASDNGPDDEGYSLTGRAHIAAINEAEETLHLGGAVRYRDPQGTARFRSRGESHVIGERLVDTGVINDVDNFTTYAAEAYYRHGPLALQAEYNITDLDSNTANDPSFDGGYVTLSYFLTGEQRSYKAKNGTIGRVKPFSVFSLENGGLGAWEVAGRYNFVDLNDENITGGELDSYTAGLNWYPNSRVKFMLNYVYNDLDNNAAFADADPQYIMLRSQLDF